MGKSEEEYFYSVKMMGLNKGDNRRVVHLRATLKGPSGGASYMGAGR